MGYSLEKSTLEHAYVKHLDFPDVKVAEVRANPPKKTKRAHRKFCEPFEIAGRDD